MKLSPGERLVLSGRFMRHVETGGECWTWTGADDGRGRHGRFSWPGRRSMIGAHVASFLLFLGRLRRGDEVDHRCRNPRCVRPSHLERVSHRENMRRIRAKKCARGLHAMRGRNVLVMGARKARVCRECRNARRRAERRCQRG